MQSFATELNELSILTMVLQNIRRQALSSLKRKKMSLRNQYQSQDIGTKGFSPIRRPLKLILMSIIQYRHICCGQDTEQVSDLSCTLILLSIPI